MRAIDITNKRFGRLVAIKKNGFHQSPSRKHILWDCICDCGNIANIRLNALMSGMSKSCGCLIKEGNNKTHGMSNTREYITWAHIITRCNNPKDKYYGARGIRVCGRWVNSFQNFYDDMGERPKNMSIERIDNNGDYEPNNCKWASINEQARNKRNNRVYELNGERMVLSDWAKRNNISFASMFERIEKWPLEKALSTLNMKKEN